jgi:hypothetical protein
VCESVQCNILHNGFTSCVGVVTVQYSAPLFQLMSNGIGGVMVSVLVWSAVIRGFEPRSGKTKGYAIGICCFSAKHTALRRKTKDWLAQNQNNVYE